MKRRHWLTAGVATAAGLAGAGWAWWRLQPHAVADTDPALHTLWTNDWIDPHGQPLALAAYRGRPVLLNFWATWCPPCVEELPLLNAFYREHQARGWQVVGLAVDQPSAVRQFLGRQPVDFPIAMAGLDGTELSRQLGNPSGGLPFTVVLDRNGAIAQRKLGRVQPQDLAQWVQAL